MKPYLLTSHLRVYSEVFRATIDRAAVLNSAGYLAAYTAVTTAVAMIVFDRRDVTC